MAVAWSWLRNEREMSMDHLQWREGFNLQPLLVSLYGKVTTRKLRLLSAAFCRRCGHLLPDEQLVLAADAAEAYADRRIRKEALARAHAAIQAVQRRTYVEDPIMDRKGQSQASAIRALWWATHPTRRHFADHVADNAAAAVAYWSMTLAESSSSPAIRRFLDVYQPGHQAECAAQLALLRDVLGPSLTPRHSFPRAWLRWNDSTPLNLAVSIYEDKAFDRLGVLADALEEAGCDDQELLTHCHSQGPHARGCWVVDWILGKEQGR